MATTYKKPLKTIQVIVHGMEDSPLTIADTAASPKASNALAEFSDYKTMHLPGAGPEGADVLIPFHAVTAIYVTVAQSDDITRPDICD